VLWDISFRPFQVRSSTPQRLRPRALPSPPEESNNRVINKVPSLKRKVEWEREDSRCSYRPLVGGVFRPGAISGLLIPGLSPSVASVAAGTIIFGVSKAGGNEVTLVPHEGPLDWVSTVLWAS
jgi:hypothetical protein